MPTRLLLACVCLATSVHAQTAYTIALYPALATSTATPISAVTYPATQARCGQAIEIATALEVNQTEAHFDDPASPVLFDCVLPVTPQISALAIGTYKAALKPNTGTTFGAFSNVFAVQVPHPCDGTPPTLASAVEGARTLTWCSDGQDANLQPTTITGWALYTDGVRSTLSGVTIGATANATGEKLCSAVITITRGMHVYTVAGVNATGEGSKSDPLTATITAAAAPPKKPKLRGVQ